MSARSARDTTAAFALALLDLPSFGARKTLDAIGRFGSPEAAYLEVTGTGAAERLVSYAREHPLFDYEEVLRRTRELGGDFKLWSDADYPANLSQWEGRPPVLFYKGDLAGLAPRSLALVGRVDPTPGGVDAATRFARLCVDHGINVVSGLAKGIDGASHRAALADPPGKTYAVVGHGLDYAYPAENRDLYAEIPSHGAVISQFPTGTGPQRWTFPARNEVMCTLALGTVIIEAKEGCGSIIQADFSFKHGRPVFILSKNLKREDSEWARKLVARGAHVIERFEQVLELVERAHGELWEKPSASQPIFDLEELMTTPAPRAALFDIDGVVVDSRDAIVATVQDIARKHTGAEVAASRVQPSLAPHKALAAVGVSDAYSVYRSEYNSALGSHMAKVLVFQDMVAEVARLRQDGVKIAAVTNQSRDRVRKMVPPEVRQLFDTFLDWTDTRGDKAAGIEAALRRLGVAGADAVFVGDQPGDLDAARKAGVRSVAVLWGFSTEAELSAWLPDLMVSTPADAYTAIHSLLADH